MTTEAKIKSFDLNGIKCSKHLPATINSKCQTISWLRMKKKKQLSAYGIWG